MDIVAHTLWAGAGMVLLRRGLPSSPRNWAPSREAITRPVVAATMGLAALPDIPHLLPIVGWWVFGGGTPATVQAYAQALPGQEPALPPTVLLVSHHLHCSMHSVFVVGAVTLLLWVLLRVLWLPLLGWWSHIVIDVFTHSADYYPSPVLYPITQRGFDGIAWNTPWFLALNYVALGAMGLWLLRGRRRAQGAT